jgi:thiamine-monophosphate kinase
MNEFELIRALLDAMPPLPEAVVVGPGDDAAVVRPGPETDSIFTTDTLVEGVHVPEGCPPRLLARRALAVNLSDLAAMGADAGAYLVAITAPRLDAPWMRAFAAGLQDAAGDSGAVLVGGNLARGPLSVSVTATGSVPRGEALLRSGARSGDGLYVSGRVGAAAVALARLRAAPEMLARLDPEAPDASVTAYLAPVPRLALGLALRGRASACIDVSDGLFADLHHLCVASGVGARVTLERVPVEGEPMEALAAGDDYELLFTLPANREEGMDALAAAGQVAVTRIGRIVAEDDGVVLIDGDGQPLPVPAAGWDHFRATDP